MLPTVSENWHRDGEREDGLADADVLYQSEDVNHTLVVFGNDCLFKKDKHKKQNQDDQLNGVRH